MPAHPYPLTRPVTAERAPSMDRSIASARIPLTPPPRRLQAAR